MTVFQNPSKRQQKQMPAKKDMIWFTGSNEDDEQAMHDKSIENISPSQILKQGQRTQEGFSRKLNPLPSSQNPLTNSNRRSGSNETYPPTKKKQSLKSQQINNHLNFSSHENLLEQQNLRATLGSNVESSRKKYSVDKPQTVYNVPSIANPNISNLLDSTGNISAKKLAQFEPSGHQLQPGPFIMGTSQLNDQLKSFSPTNGKVRTNTQLQNHLLNQISKTKEQRMPAQQMQMLHMTNQNPSASNHASNTSGTKSNYRSGSRGNSRKKVDKKKQLYEAYTPYNLI